MMSAPENEIPLVNKIFKGIKNLHVVSTVVSDA